MSNFMEKQTNPVMMWLPQQHNGPCAKKFMGMLSNRQHRPLKSGLYKLKESLRTIEQYEDEIDLLSSLLRKGEPLRGRHTYGDHVYWIKKIPLFIAEEYGFNVLPAVHTLSGDGVPQKVVTKYISYFEKCISNLILLCDQVHMDIKRPISEEYDLWRNRRSKLDDLLFRAQSIINTAINMAQDHKPSPPPIHGFSE